MNPSNKEVPCFIIILGVFAICVFVPTPLVTIDIIDIEMGVVFTSPTTQRYSTETSGLLKLRAHLSSVVSADQL